jgi:hypothetical protein
VSDEILSSVLGTLATNWVTCECAMRIANHGLDGWQKKIPQVDAEIDRLNAQLEVVESASKKDELTAKRETLKAQSQALFDEWKKADEETDDYRILFRDALSFCNEECPGLNENHDFDDLFIASLFDFTPQQISHEAKFAESLEFVDKCPRDKWDSQPWANPVKPTMKAARRVAPNHRQSFITQPNVLDVFLRTPPS